MLTEPKAPMQNRTNEVSKTSIREQVDSLRIAQCEAWQRGEWISVEALVANRSAIKSLHDDDLLELILAERMLRKSLGPEPNDDEYAKRFPALSARLGRLFACDAGLNNHSLAGSMPISDLLNTINQSIFEHRQFETIVPQSGVEKKLTSNVATPYDASPKMAETEYGKNTSDGNAVQANKHGSAIAAKPLAPGMKVGKYKLESRLGQGGMGTVFRASHSLIDHQVALKVMLPHLVNRPSLQERFLKEAQLCVNLQHPNLVRTLDIDQDNGCLYLTMELLNGLNLAERVESQGVLSSTAAAKVIRQAASGLAYAHGKGIVHRDIKPQNIMTTSDGTIKILDLGLAKLRGDFNELRGGRSLSELGSQGVSSFHGPQQAATPSQTILTEDGRLTFSGAILGTIGYMAAEQVVHPSEADARSDIYSLGCTAFYLLTGKSIHGDTPFADILRDKVQCSQWPELRLDSICSNWQPIIKRMVAWNAADRFASFEEFITELDRVFIGNPAWQPAPDDLETLRSKLLEFGVVSAADWSQAEASYFQTMRYSGSTISMSLMTPSSTPAYEFLFHLTESKSVANGEPTLTQYQVKQILAGHIDALRHFDHLVLESLNYGWKGEIFKCRNLSSEKNEIIRTIATKNLRGLSITTADQSDFQKAIEKLTNLNHPNVAKVFNGEILDDIAVISGEFIPGIILGAEVRKNGCDSDPIEAERFIQSALDMALGVAHLHGHGLCHLDLSTERWVRRENGSLCLLDSGIAPLILPKRWEDIPASAGMPPVIAPEMQGNLAASSPAADVYALGHVFRFLRTGNFPFRSMRFSDLPRPQIPTTLRRSRSLSDDAHPASIEACAQDLASPRSDNWGEAFERLIQDMTQPRLRDRIESMSQVVQRLEHVMDLAIQTTRSRTNSQPDKQSLVNPPSSMSARMREKWRQLFRHE